MDELNLFGQYDDNGDLLEDSDSCILSGRPIEPGDPTFAIGRYFYRVSLSALAQHTDEVRTHLASLINKETKKSSKSKES